MKITMFFCFEYWIQNDHPFNKISLVAIVLKLFRTRFTQW